MFKKLTLFVLAAAVALTVYSCEKEEYQSEEVVIPQEIIDKVYHLGFNPDGIIPFEDGYIVEGDIFLSEAFLDESHDEHFVPEAEQYRTTNVVSTGGNRVITIYMPSSGRRGFNSTYQAALDDAIARYNALGLDLTFQRTGNASSADIEVRRYSFFQEVFQGLLAQAGFPSGGDPYDEIFVNGRVAGSFAPGGLATVIAHELGHCIGFRHTDYFDRSVSCGGSPTNEGSAGVGAILIPGTPSGASVSDGSWMLSCTDGSSRPFNNDDRTALRWMYDGNF